MSFSGTADRILDLVESRKKTLTNTTVSTRCTINPATRAACDLSFLVLCTFCFAQTSAGCRVLDQCVHERHRLFFFSFSRGCHSTAHTACCLTLASSLLLAYIADSLVDIAWCLPDTSFWWLLCNHWSHIYTDQSCMKYMFECLFRCLSVCLSVYDLLSTYYLLCSPSKIPSISTCLILPRRILSHAVSSNPWDLRPFSVCLQSHPSPSTITSHHRLTHPSACFFSLLYLLLNQPLACQTVSSRPSKVALRVRPCPIGLALLWEKKRKQAKKKV